MSLDSLFRCKFQSRFNWTRVTVSALALVLTVSCGDTDQVSDLDASGSNGACPSNIQWATPVLPKNNADLLTLIARDYFGKQVGDGECAELANIALRKLNLKTFYHLGPTGFDADYVWGDLITTLSPENRNGSALRRGDVLQYRNFSQEYSKDGSDGRWTSSASHHTSVVARVSADGRHVCVYEQNVGGRKTVNTGYIDLNGIKGGWIKAYRPKH